MSNPTPRPVSTTMLRRPVGIFIASAFVLGRAHAAAQHAWPGATAPSYPTTSNRFAARVTIHWPHFPLRVYFAPGGAASHARRQWVCNGFFEWTTASAGHFRFVVVDEPSDADVRVELLDTPNVPPNPSSVGETYTRSHGTYFKQARIQFATRDVPEAVLTEVAAHEWGHALGIEGHSADPDDLMYPAKTRIIDSDGVEEPTPPRTVRVQDVDVLRGAYGF